MKIVCESCGAKYSIADEKVIGKVFKIRCKKCSDTIVVRGDQMDSDDEEATRVFDFGGDAAWHVVVDGQQQGPFAPIQITGLLNTGKIDEDAYVWKEGFEGWLPLKEVPELAAQVSDSSAPEASAEEEAAFESDDAPASFEEPAQESAEEADDPFAAAAASAPDTTSGAAKKDDLFGDDSGADPFASSSDVVSSAPSTSQQSQPATMTGARNENSVLFSLSNLQGLGASAPSSSSSSSGFGSASQPAASQPAGAAAGDASGLIDIRNLAAAATATGTAPKASAESAVDDLLSVGTGVAGLGGGALGSTALGGRPLGAPAAAEEEPAPVAAAPAPAPAASKAPMILAAVAIIGLLAALIVVLMRDSGPQEPLAVAPQGVQQAGEATPTGAAPSGDESAKAAADGEDSADEADEKAAAEEAAKEEEPEPSTATKTASTKASTSRSTSTSTMTTSQPSTKSTSSSSSSTKTTSTMTTTMSSTSMSSGDISSLLDKAVSGGSTMTTTTSAASNLPDTPSRSAVSSALGAVAPQARACGNGTDGTARATVTFTGSTGRVSNVSVSGVDATIGRCVERAARNAKVPPFKQSTFNVTYPFRVQ